MRVTVIINAGSGRSEQNAARIPKLMAARGIELRHLELVPDEKALRKRVKHAVKSGARYVVVGGGDGSMTTAVDVLAERNVVLGVLPLGTGNSFARTVGIDNDDLETAIDAIAHARVERVDLGMVNGTYFANFATIGLSAEIALNTPRRLKKVLGAAAYVAAAIEPFVKSEPFRATIGFDERKIKLETQQIIIASGRFFGHQPLTPDASATSHQLAFFTTTGVSHVELARTYLALGLGLQDQLPDAVTFTAGDIVLRTRPRQAISIDGNPFGKTPAHFRVAPRALRVLVGPAFDTTNA